MKNHMPFAQKLAFLATPAALMLCAAPALAALTPTTSEWYDLDHDGRMDRAIVTLANADQSSLTVTDVSRLKITYNGATLAPTAAYFASTGNPAKLVLAWDEGDTNLPVDTSIAKFAVVWPDFGLTASLNKIDRAAPILVSSTPAASSVGVGRMQDVVLNFSEPVDQPSFAWSVSNDPDSWTVTWSDDGKTAALTHGKFNSGAVVIFTITVASDAAGNSIKPGAVYPNPFRYNTSSNNISNSEISPQFLINEPRADSALKAGEPAVLAWYSNDAAITQVRISWSTDGGSTYRVIATRPVKDGAYVWYPPNEPGGFILKAEGLSNSGGIVNLDVLNPLTLVASNAGTPIGFEAVLPPLPPNQPVQGTAPTTPVAPTPAPEVITPIIPHFTVNPTVTAFDPKAKTGVLTWQTDVPTTSDVIYGKRLNYSLTLKETVSTTEHRLVLTGLTPGAMHNLRVTAISATGDAVATGDVFFQFLREGDRIKGKGPEIYWWKGGVKRHFPNPKTFLYWTRSWASVITIGDTQLNWLPTGTPVKIGKTP